MMASRVPVPSRLEMDDYFVEDANLRSMIFDPTVRDIIQWDVANWAQALRYWENHSTHDLARCLSLEIGGRYGGLSLWLALQGSEVVCSDIVRPSGRAERLHQKYNVSDRIRYESLDAINIPYEDAFDVIVFKSVLGAVGRDDRICRQRKAVMQMYKALKPGGSCFSRRI